MSWKTRRRGKPSQRGLRFKSDRTLFFTAEHKKYSDVVSFEDTTQASKSATQLNKEFSGAQTRAKKVRVKRVAVSASNRALAASKSPKLSSARKKELRHIASVYRHAYQRMELPPRR